MTIQTTPPRIKIPTVVRPHKGSIQFNTYFMGSEYITIGRFKLLHEKSHWQLSLDPLFDTLLDEYMGGRHLRSWSPKVDYSKYPKTKIYVRVKYGVNTIWSGWSEPNHVTTI